MAEIKALYSGDLSVTGIGRVGSYAAARKARRCRPHRYWAIQEFEEKPGAPCNEFHERTDLGRFKTKKAANRFLWDAHLENGYLLLYGDLNSYVHIKINK